jgi:WhiB family redox-sensing transcriptional regulator
MDVELTPGVWIIRHNEWQSANDLFNSDDSFEPDPELDTRSESRPAGNGKNLPFPSWHLQAACVGEAEEKFFGARDITERPAVSMSDVARAKAVCAPCPVFRTCLSTALGLLGENREEYGIWAGTSGRTRKRIWELVDREEVTLQEVVDDICSGDGYHYERSAVLRPITITALKVGDVAL